MRVYQSLVEKNQYADSRSAVAAHLKKKIGLLCENV
jgi:hypothetical protein